jgi:NAD(P)-dependent dehydrogenase (short-subunit alcohol dehydrogenase family)
VTRQLDGSIALVTGAGRGLGRAIAIAYAREGAHVWISARTESELALTADQIRRCGGRVDVVRADLGDPSGCAALFDTVKRASRLDVLVNNAAVLDFVPVDELPLAVWQRALAVNLTAPFFLVQAFLPEMREHGGSIINVSSRAGVLGFATEAAYCASKFGLEGFTRALALELSGAPVSVNTVTPGLRIKPTSVTDADVEHRPQQEREQWQDPDRLMPAFLLLARLRGEVSGRRFDACRLSTALVNEPGMSLAQVKEMAE